MNDCTSCLEYTATTWEFGGFLIDAQTMPLGNRSSYQDTVISRTLNKSPRAMNRAGAECHDVRIRYGRMVFNA